MVAPNGARKTKADHPALPTTIAELVDVASACHGAGADMLHAHVRNENGDHVLDAGLYRELIVEMARAVPAMGVQITTEAVGRYSPEEQRDLVAAVQPKAVSVALREMTSDSDVGAQRAFYFDAKEAGIDLQHILYTPEEIIQLAGLVADEIIPPESLSLLFVLGRYSEGQISSPSDLRPFTDALTTSGLKSRAKFMVCAFGQHEVACLLAATQMGGDCRIGFENNHLKPDGTLAENNSAQVTALVAALNAL